MLKVLVTGANGFFGRAIISKLMNKDVNILTFTRKNNFNDLHDLVLISDFIYHFAGEVKTGQSASSYQKSNYELTKKIINILELNNKKTSILFTSSIHSDSSRNFYGETKKKAECLIQDYAVKNSSRCYIYKLPHVFGKGCKPNYNSVVTTWIYNSIKNLEITIYDKKIKMNYIYIEDIIKEFVDLLKFPLESLYLKPKLIYPTTLGNVLDYIEEFKLNIDNLDYEIFDNDFKKKLYQTYQNYSLDLKNEST